MRQSLAMLQPSLFEGWSTPVEEAKSLGKSIVLSNIPVHVEQSPPGVRYFDPTDAAALAVCLVEVHETQQPGPDAELEAAARDALPLRTREYGEVFMNMVDDAMQAAPAR